MTIYQIRKASEEMEIPFREAAFCRFRFLRQEMPLLLAEVERLADHPDETTRIIFGKMAVDRFLENAREQRALMLAVKKPATDNRITDDMVQQARSFPVTQLIPFQRGKYQAWCHEDRNPSLYHAPRINKAVCPVCNKYFSSIDILVQRDGLTFVDAVRRLAA